MHDLIGKAIADQLGALQDNAGSPLFQHIQIYDNPGTGYLAELDVVVAKNIMWSRLWVVGTPAKMAAVSLDLFSQEVTLPGFWGDKALTPEEGILSIASANSINDLMKRLHQAHPNSRYAYGDHSIMRNLYRNIDFIQTRVKETLKEKGHTAAVIWRSQELSPTEYLHSCLDVESIERDSETVLIMRVD